MKRIIILLVLMFFICGCSRKLTCTYKVNYEDITIDNEITFNFKEDIYKQKDTMTFLDNESAKDYFEDVEVYVEEYNLVLEKNKIISELSGDIKLDAKEDEIKTQYESYGYKCR